MSTIQRAILIISDDKDTTHIIQAALAEDYAIMTIATQEALTSVIGKHNNFACIIMDQQLSEDPITIHALKSNFMTIHIPVIILAKNVSPNDIVDAAEQGADDFVQKPIDAITLRARLLMNIRRAERDQNASPLTKLPGSSIVNKIITQRLTEPLAVLYADLNNFKTYNDKYGYAMGDRMIQQTAQLLALALQKHGNSNDFLGHIGGDDFIAISTPDHIEAISRYIATHFDLHTKQLYDEHDLSREKMIIRNRQGTQHLLPLISISLAVITNEKRPLSCVPQIAQIAAELKQFAKNRAQDGERNICIKDRRQG